MDLNEIRKLQERIKRELLLQLVIAQDQSVDYLKVDDILFLMRRL